MGASPSPWCERASAPTGGDGAERHSPLPGKTECQVMDFDQLDAKDWVLCKPKESHWADGFRIARPISNPNAGLHVLSQDAPPLGVFTMALKLAVVPCHHPPRIRYMKEMHGSPNGRKMIAELNQPFKPALIVLDGVDAFVDGGPGKGTLARGNAFLASTDRVAIDAVGVAILKHLGSNETS